MSLKDQILERTIDILVARHENPHKVLDSKLFQDMTPEEKIDFINGHKGALGSSPKFKWGSIPTGALLSGSLATGGTLLHQFGTRVGAGGFKPNVWALGGAAVMGALVGGTVSAGRANQDYQRDLNTKKNVDDAISMIVSRGMTTVPTKADYLNRIQNYIEEAPLTYGKAMSSIDFDSLDKK